MSFNEGIEVKLHKRRVLDAEISSYLIEHPWCLDGKIQKEMAYKIAIDYFTSKQEECKSTGNVSCNWVETIKLGTLVDEYFEAEGDDEKKKNYANKIARYIIDAPTAYLNYIPNETKDIAFEIIIKNLEEAMSS